MIIWYHLRPSEGPVVDLQTLSVSVGASTRSNACGRTQYSEELALMVAPAGASSSTIPAWSMSQRPLMRALADQLVLVSDRQLQGRLLTAVITTLHRPSSSE